MFGAYAGATTEVAAFDVDSDGDQDIIVGNREPMPGATPTMSRNFVLYNDAADNLPFTSGVTSLTTVFLDATSDGRDTRSIAVGDINETVGPPGAPQTSPEIVAGNAGSGGFGTEESIPLADDDPLQIYEPVWSGAPISQSYVTVPSDYGEYIKDAAKEREWTSGLTFQVLLQDVIKPETGGKKIEADGHLDLILVNHRYMLNQKTPGQPNSPLRDSGNNIRILANTNGIQVPDGMGGMTPAFIFQQRASFEPFWCKTVAFANYVQVADQSTSPGGFGRVEPFIGTGNRFAGIMSFQYWATSDSDWVENVSPSSTSAGFETTYDVIPGNERGYGFDFAVTGAWGTGMDVRGDPKIGPPRSRDLG